MKKIEVNTEQFIKSASYGNSSQLLFSTIFLYYNWETLREGLLCTASTNIDQISNATIFKPNKYHI